MFENDNAETAADAEQRLEHKMHVRLKKSNFAFIITAVVLTLTIPMIFATAANTNEVAKIEEINLASANAAPSATPELPVTTDGELVSDLTEMAQPSPAPTPTHTPEPTATPIPEPVYTVLSSGMEDSFVAEIQQRLMDLDYMEPDETTALFGPITTQSIEYFQRKNGLPIDGIAGIETQKILFSDSAKRYTVSEGASGPDVESLQQRLDELGYSVTADGSFGPTTTNAVKYFQRMNGLAEDGNVGLVTRETLYSQDAEPSLEYSEAKSSSEDEDSENSDSDSSGSEAPAPSPSASQGSEAPAPTPSPSASQGGETPAPATSGAAEAFINAALAQLGKTYVLGGKGPDIFDCSGLVYYALQASGNGISYMTSYGWADSGYTRIDSMQGLQRGDVVCVKGHVGVYLGDGQVVHASSSNGKVVIASNIFNSSYWTGNFICGRRPL